MSKAVLVYGIGISGCGAADILARQGKRVLLYNDAEHEVDNDLKELLAKSGGQIVIGKKEGLLDDVEEVILSPGISMENPLVQEALNRGINVTGEAELAYRNYNGHIVGITGTNGKTTTTILIGEMLATLPCVTKVGGNIGMALTKEVETMPENSWLAAELSSFQLETVQNFRAEIAVILNLTPDHLTRHHTMEAYGAAKCNIFKNQHPEDVTLLNLTLLLKAGAGLCREGCAGSAAGKFCRRAFICRTAILLLPGTILKKLSATEKICRFLAGITKKTCLLLLVRRFLQELNPVILQKC